MVDSYIETGIYLFPDLEEKTKCYINTNRYLPKLDYTDEIYLNLNNIYFCKHIMLSLVGN